MTHPAFEQPNNLLGIRANEWERMAIEAEKGKHWALAARYWYNVSKTALSVRKSKLAKASAERCVKMRIE